MNNANDKKKIKGPKTDPWGTPWVTKSEEDGTPAHAEYSERVPVVLIDE